MLSDRCLSVRSVCDVGVLWPNGWMDQDEPRHAGRPRPWPYCVRWRPSSPPQKGAEPPIFGPFLLWPNGWMDQDGTWHGWASVQAHCTRLGPSSPSQKGTQSPIFGQCPLWPNGWMDQDATWYGDKSRPRRRCVRRGPSSPRKGHSSPLLFGPCLLWPRSPISATAELLFLF